MSLPYPFDCFQPGQQVILVLRDMDTHTLRLLSDLFEYGKNLSSYRDNAIRVKIHETHIEYLGWDTTANYCLNTHFRSLPMLTAMDFLDFQSPPITPVDDLSDLLGGGF